MQQFEQTPIESYTEQAYHNYAMYVILDRAIPRLEDGLKPVQRRIVYAMSQLGLQATSKPKKSARTVGDVLGKFHPHGDSACYEAMVLMAQSFSYRYPLVQGQGNWGAIDDPKSFAAMRYTEANLSPYAQVLLKHLNAQTTQWGPNFDGTLKEPIVLPTALPNILLNGASGIAVGLATDIPPHNLAEVGQACIALIKKPRLDEEALQAILPGPDYPTGAEVINTKSELLAILKTGQGQIKQRAVYRQDGEDLIIHELPHQVSSSKIIQQIADLMIAKKLPAVKSIRDDSDEESPVSIVLTLRSNRVRADEVMAVLFAETDLEKNHKVNITYISPDRKPTQSGYLSLLKQWLSFYENSLLKRLRHQLNQAQDRLHIIDGLLVVFDHLDEVIKIIRYDETPKATLITRFSLSEVQATAILETKLKHLANLEVLSLKDEHETLSQEAQSLSELLSDEILRKKRMISDLRAEMKQFGDNRRTALVERAPAQKISQTIAIPKEPVTVLLSKKHWVRAAKGHDVDPQQATFKTGDALASSIKGYSHWPTILFDEKGMAYTLPTHELPSGRSQGDPVTTMISPSSPLTNHLLNAHPEQKILLASALGYGFVSDIQSLSSRNKSGKKALSLSDTKIADILPISSSCTHVALATQQGRLIIIPIADIPSLSKGKGNKLVQIHKKDHADNTDLLAFMLPISTESPLVISSGKRFFKVAPKDLPTYTANRGQRGVLLPRGYRRVTAISQPQD